MRLRQLLLALARRPRTWFTPGFLLVVVLAGSGTSPAQQRPADDPVEELRQVLKQDRDPGRTPEGLEFRKNSLRKSAAKVTRLGDLSRALLLTDWRDEGLDRELAGIDFAVRQEMADRFIQGMQKALEGGDVPVQGAAANLVGEMAASAREAGIKSPFVHRTISRLVPDLLKLSRGSDPRLAEIAIRALGKVQGRQPRGKGPEGGESFTADVIVPDLALVIRDGTVGEKRAAAEALASLVNVLIQVEKKSRTDPTSDEVRRELLRTASLVVPAAAEGLRDADAGVRRLSGEAILQAGVALSDMIYDPPPRDWPPEGRALTPEEQKEIEIYRQAVEAERLAVTPLMKALGAAAPDLAKAVNDQDLAVRLVARRGLEEMGVARLRLLRRAASVPPTGPAAKEPDKGSGEESEAPQPPTRPVAGEVQVKLPEDPLLDGLKQTLRALAQGLADPDVRARLAAIDALEVLLDEAASAAPALAWSLGDPDRFVRWAAARTLGRIDPAKVNVNQVVPGLIRLLYDPDLDLRITAAHALERYGPAAAAAVPYLADVAGKGDPEIRVAAIQTLPAIGKAGAKGVPAIGAALANPDVRVRQAAAEALARFGPDAAPAADALNRALTDDDPKVRRFASEALLSIGK